MSVSSEAALRGGTSPRPAGQSDPEEPNSDPAVPGRRAGSAAGGGEEVRPTMGRRKRQTGINQRATEGQRSS